MDIAKRFDRRAERYGAETAVPNKLAGLSDSGVRNGRDG